MHPIRIKKKLVSGLHRPVAGHMRTEHHGLPIPSIAQVPYASYSLLRFVIFISNIIYSFWNKSWSMIPAQIASSLFMSSPVSLYHWCHDKYTGCHAVRIGNRIYCTLAACNYGEQTLLTHTSLLSLLLLPPVVAWSQSANDNCSSPITPQLARLSWCRAFFWGPWPDLFFSLVWQLLGYWSREPSLTRGRVCSLQYSQSLV
jgi:hypothetical protein